MLDALWRWILKFFEGVLGRNTLYYPGCLAHIASPELEENYKELLSRLGVEFMTIPEFNCCGSPVMRAGYEEDFEELKRRNLELFSKYGIKKIITNCPGCYNMLKNNYGLEVQHVTQVIENKLSKLKYRKRHEKVTYHDPCHLGRHSGIYDEPRSILRKIGFEVEELEESRENALCCGAGGGLKSNSPKLANKIARNVLANVKTKKLVTPCPMCCAHFRENSKGVEIVELGELLIKDIREQEKEKKELLEK